MRKGQKRKHQSKMAEGQEIGLLNGEVHRMDERPEHGMKVLQGLNKLKTDHVLCDVTLIAEGNDFVCLPPLTVSPLWVWVCGCLCTHTHIYTGCVK